MNKKFEIKNPLRVALFVLNVLMSLGLLAIAISGGYGMMLSFILFFMLAMQLTIHGLLVWMHEWTDHIEIEAWKKKEAERKQEQSNNDLAPRYAARVRKPGDLMEDEYLLEEIDSAYIGDDGELVYREDQR